jgi:hypothetical protein
MLAAQRVREYSWSSIIQQGEVELVKAFVDAGTRGMRASDIAAAQQAAEDAGHAERAALLAAALAAHTPMSATDNQGRTPLHDAAAVSTAAVSPEEDKEAQQKGHAPAAGAPSRLVPFEVRVVGSCHC